MRFGFGLGLGAVFVLIAAAAGPQALAQGELGSTLNANVFGTTTSNVQFTTDSQGAVTMSTRTHVLPTVLAPAPSGQPPRVTVLQFSGAWCNPCKREAPVLDGLMGRCGNSANVVEMLTGALQDGKPPQGKALEPWFRRQHATVVNSDEDADDTVRAQLGISALPSTVILVDGKVVYRADGSTARAVNGGGNQTLTDQGLLFAEPSAGMAAEPPEQLAAKRLACIVRNTGLSGTQGFSCGANAAPSAEFCRRVIGSGGN